MRISNLGRGRPMSAAAAAAVVQFDDLPATTLAQPRHTVDLNARPWPLYLLWAGVAGLLVYALMPKTQQSNGPDALDVLRREG